MSISQINLRVHCVCARRYHAAFTDLCCVLLHLSVPLHLVVPLPDLRHAHLQLHVCADGHFQCWTHHCPLPLPVPVLSGVHPPRGQLDQVRRMQGEHATEHAQRRSRSLCCPTYSTHTVSIKQWSILETLPHYSSQNSSPSI